MQYKGSKFQQEVESPEFFLEILSNNEDQRKVDLVTLYNIGLMKVKYEGTSIKFFLNEYRELDTFREISEDEMKHILYSAFKNIAITNLLKGQEKIDGKNYVNVEE